MLDFKETHAHTQTQNFGYTYAKHMTLIFSTLVESLLTQQLPKLGNEISLGFLGIEYIDSKIRLIFTMQNKSWLMQRCKDSKLHINEIKVLMAYLN